MRELFENWNKFLEDQSETPLVGDTTTRIFHFSKLDTEAITLDPAYFTKSASHYSRNEKATSSVPRVFFYLDKDRTERIVVQGRKMYYTDVPSSAIYDLRKDPEGLIQKARHPIYGLRKGIEWDDLLNSIKENYGGVKYTIHGDMGIVAWFEPIEVKRYEEAI